MKSISIFIAAAILSGCNPIYQNDPIQEVVSVRDENQVYPIVIIGSGAAGTMAVKRAILDNNQVLLFLGANQDCRRSRGNWVKKVDNVPGLERYERPILELCNETLANIYQGSFSQNLYTVEDSVIQIEKTGDLFKLTDSSGCIYYGQHVLLATGIMDEQPNIQGSIRPILTFSNGQTVAYCLVCDGHRCLNQNTVVIGYREESASGAILLAEKYHPPSLSILTNGNTPEFSESTLEKLKEYHITVHTSSILDVQGDRSSRQLQGFTLESGVSISAEMGFVMLGIRPNNQLALQLGANVDPRGLVLTDSSGESSIANLFIAGDLRSGSMKQIYTAWQHSVECIQHINTRLRNVK